MVIPEPALYTGLAPAAGDLCCRVAALPMRADASERAEMVSQVLYGERVRPLESRGGWRRVACLYDGYQGWVDAKCLAPAGDAPTAVVSALAWRPDTDTLPALVPAGAEVPAGLLPAPDAPESLPAAEAVARLAMAFRGTPYLWGGRSSLGIDCSGFVQTLFKINGIWLPRDARDQVALGAEVAFAQDLRPGDLAFFGDTDQAITHVGVALGGGLIAHASGWVRVDEINHQGIFDRAGRRYTHRLRVAKRVAG